jgi:hypothetical protein
MPELKTTLGFLVVTCVDEKNCLSRIRLRIRLTRGQEEPFVEYTVLRPNRFSLRMKFKAGESPCKNGPIVLKRVHAKNEDDAVALVRELVEKHRMQILDTRFEPWN